MVASFELVQLAHFRWVCWRVVSDVIWRWQYKHFTAETIRFCRITLWKASITAWLRASCWGGMAGGRKVSIYCWRQLDQTPWAKPAGFSLLIFYNTKPINKHEETANGSHRADKIQNDVEGLNLTYDGDLLHYPWARIATSIFRKPTSVVLVAVCVCNRNLRRSSFCRHQWRKGNNFIACDLIFGRHGNRRDGG